MIEREDSPITRRDFFRGTVVGIATPAAIWPHFFGRVGLLEGHEEHKRNVAVVLENQRLFNEENELPQAFIRMSIPLLRRVLQTDVPFSISLYIRRTLRDGDPLGCEATGIVFDLPGEEAHQVEVLSEKLKVWLKKWAVEQGGTFRFSAIGLADGKVVLYDSPIKDH